MIRNIVFDMGNVLIRWSPKNIIARLGLSEEDSALMLREVFQGFEWVAIDHGTLSQQEGYERIRARLPARLHDAAASCVFGWWKPPLEPIPGMADLVRELKELGYRYFRL